MTEPAGCVGIGSENAGKAPSCQGCPSQAICAAGIQPDPALPEIKTKMSDIKHKILVLSGKGGVGKSTFSTQLARHYQKKDHLIGLLDIDICGPSVPKVDLVVTPLLTLQMLGLEGESVHQSNMGWEPVYVDDNFAVMSIGFMLDEPNQAIIWRGPKKNSTPRLSLL